MADSPALTAAISGASAIGGALVVAVADARRYQADRRHQDRAALEARLVAFTSAFDALTLELRALPKQSRRSELVAEWMERRMPTVTFFFNRIARAVLGRKLFAVLVQFQEASNALLIGGPPREVLAASEQIANHLARFSERRSDFFDDLDDARADFVEVAFLATRGDLARQRCLRLLFRRRRAQLPPRVQARLDEAEDTFATSSREDRSTYESRVPDGQARAQDRR